MVTTHALGACTERFGGSSPSTRTIFTKVQKDALSISNS